MRRLLPHGEKCAQSHRNLRRVTYRGRRELDEGGAYGNRGLRRGRNLGAGEVARRASKKLRRNADMSSMAEHHRRATANVRGAEISTHRSASSVCVIFSEAR